MKKRSGILAIALCICAVIGVVCYLFRPYSADVTVDGIRRGVRGGISAQVSEDCYELESAADFADAFRFEAWEQTRSAPAGAPTIRLRLAEEWVVELYDDGSAAAHYGYASWKTKGDAYYRVPSDCAAAVADYIAAHGALQTQAFSDSHFRY